MADKKDDADKYLDVLDYLYGGNSSAYGSWIEDLDREYSKDKGKFDDAFDKAWGRYEDKYEPKKCTCGAEVTYGKGTKHHSDWCDLYTGDK